MISLSNVHKAYDELVVLAGVDFEVRAGETGALRGPAGVGQSVVLVHINGIMRPDQGGGWVVGGASAAVGASIAWVDEVSPIAAGVLALAVAVALSGILVAVD